MYAQVMEEARQLLESSGTWYEFKHALQERRLDRVLSALDLEDFSNLWNQRQASKMDDMTLAAELSFWAEGGTFDQHLQGYLATPAAFLVQSAQDRGWFVRTLASGVVVNPPRGKPLMVKTLLCATQRSEGGEG